jgi:hypothetical protein
METTNGRTPVNIVTCYFHYMWCRWDEEECQRVFHWNWEHFWSKWCSCCNPSSSGAAERFFSALGQGNDKLLVDRACECYDRDHRII